jgi:hypothetical protein
MSRRQIARSDVQVTPSRPANRTRLNTQVTGHLNWLIRAQQQDSGRNLCPCGVTRLVLAQTTARQETLAGSAAHGPRHSPWPALARTPGTRTPQKRRPTPRRSSWRPCSWPHQTHCPPGRYNCQKLPAAPGGPTYLTRRPPDFCHLKGPPRSQSQIGPTYCRRTPTRRRNSGLRGARLACGVFDGRDDVPG